MRRYKPRRARKIINKIILKGEKRLTALRKKRKEMAREIKNELKSRDKKIKKTRLKIRIFISSGGVLIIK